MSTCCVVACSRYPFDCGARCAAVLRYHSRCTTGTAVLTVRKKPKSEKTSQPSCVERSSVVTAHSHTSTRDVGRASLVSRFCSRKSDASEAHAQTRRPGAHERRQSTHSINRVRASPTPSDQTTRETVNIKTSRHFPGGRRTGPCAPGRETTYATPPRRIYDPKTLKKCILVCALSRMTDNERGAQHV